MVRPQSVLAHITILVLEAAAVANAGLWTVNLDYGPAPSPEDGPPFSAHASRDRALLPAQVCGLVGAYIGSLLITVVLLVTVGRPLRRKSQLYMDSATKMVRPTTAFDASPISPGSQRSWYSPRRLKTNSSALSSVKSGTDIASPGLESNASFDLWVLEADKAARERELEDLYAAALEQEERGLRVQTDVFTAGPSKNDVCPRSTPRLPKINTSAMSNASLRVPTDSPTSARSPIRAIYPPRSAHHAQHTDLASPGPLNPQYTRLTRGQPVSPNLPTTTRRFAESTPIPSHVSGHGGSRRFRKTLRHLHISNPMPRSPSEISDQDARTPLTPRYYTDPGTPPSPPTRSEAPTTPATYNSGTDDEDATEEIDQIRDLPKSAPQRNSEWQHHGLTLATAEPSTSTSTLGSLPFRAAANEQSSQPAHSPAFNTKLTFIERRRDRFDGARTGAATPHTPYTPYTPYMPFTPVTPVTPHLTSRAERKQRERERSRKAPAEEDRVLEEAEMWGSAY